MVSRKLIKLFMYLFFKERFLFERRLASIKNVNYFNVINERYSIGLNGLKFPVICRNQYSSDILVLKQVFETEEYKIISSLVSNNDIQGEIIDLGANIGLTSIYFANLFPNKMVISVEPDPSNYSLLEENCKRYSNISSINFAVSEISDVRFEINDSFRDGLDWSKSVKKSSKGTIPGITIDGLIDHFSIKEISILKIDIEGYEKFIFEYGDLNFLKSVKLISLEVHEEVISKITLKDILIKNNFLIFEASESLIGINKMFF